MVSKSVSRFLEFLILQKRKMRPSELSTLSLLNIKKKKKLFYKCVVSTCQSCISLIHEETLRMTKLVQRTH